MTASDGGIPDHGLTLGALGGGSTFGGQAAELFLAAYPMFVDVAYFPDVYAMFDAVDDGRIDAGCVPEQTARTGFHQRTYGRIADPGSPYVVLADITHAYHCSLLGRPGTDLSAVSTVLGHTGSVSQSRPWLQANLPDAEIVIVDTNSLGAAETVAAGDGTSVSVGTTDAAERTGLVELVTDIDGGSVGSYWAVGRDPRPAARPTRLVVVGRTGPAGGASVGAVIADLLQVGFAATTVFARPTEERLWEYDHVIRLAGEGDLSAVRGVVDAHASMRLAGAYVTAEPDI